MAAGNEVDDAVNGWLLSCGAAGSQGCVAGVVVMMYVPCSRLQAGRERSSLVLRPPPLYIYQVGFRYFRCYSGSWECGNLQTTTENTSVLRCIYQITMWISTSIL